MKQEPVRVLTALRGPVARVGVAGEIDDATVDRLVDALAGLCQPPLERVELDLSSVGYLGSAGVRALAQAADNPAGVSVQVVGASAVVRRVLELTGVDRRLLAAGPPALRSR
ncbi:MAG: STAS domain-containing protein [Acidimicrobiales bacterium]